MTIYSTLEYSTNHKLKYEVQAGKEGKQKLAAIYKSLGVDPNDTRYRFNCAFVRGVENMTEYQVAKYAELGVTRT